MGDGDISAKRITETFFQKQATTEETGTWSSAASFSSNKLGDIPVTEMDLRDE